MQEDRRRESVVYTRRAAVCVCPGGAVSPSCPVHGGRQELPPGMRRGLLPELETWDGVWWGP